MAIAQPAQLSVPRPPVVFAGEGLIELTLDGETARLDCGGDAANAATMSALLGARARLLGRVGDDPLGRRLLSFWRDRGLDTSALVVDREAATGVYVNELSPTETTGGRVFTYWRRGSAGSRWSPEDFDDPDALAHATAVVVTGVTVSLSDSAERAVWRLVEQARARSIATVCVLNYRATLGDPNLLSRLAAAVDVVIASVEDLAEVFPDRTPAELLSLAREARRELVVTDGAAGASVAWEDGIVRQRVFPVPVSDTVGAGDALAGGYVWARFEAQHPPGEALAWGVSAALLSVQREGCASSYPNAAETASMRQRLPQAEMQRDLRVQPD
jgi:sugar/nucleoside kinase (ribokinase family)